MPNFLPIAELQVPPDRMRKKFSQASIEALAADILDKGLLHAPVVRADGRTLVAGERRFRAIKHIYLDGKTFLYHGEPVPRDHIPVVPLSDLDAYRIREAELTENIIRQDLSWQEYSVALAELHAMRQEQNPKHNFTDTAEEVFVTPEQKAEPDYERGKYIGDGRTVVRQATILAPHLDDPDISSAPTRQEALKRLAKKHESELLGLAGAAMDKENKTGMVTEKCHLGRFEDILPSGAIPPFSVLIADPPYGIEADTTFGDASNHRHTYCDSWANAEKTYIALANLGFEHSLDKAHAYIFHDYTKSREVFEIFHAAGWWVWATPFIWAKGALCLYPYPDHGPRRGYEMILYAIKGGKPTTGLYSDVIHVPNLRDRVYAPQKPPDLYVNLLNRSCVPGDVVLDPTCGVGTIFAAARQLKLRAFGIELNEDIYNIARGKV
jgi:hypothetical protein